MRKFIVSLLAVCLLMSSCIQPAGNMLHAQEVTKEVQEDTISASGKIKVGITSVKALVEEENFELQLSKNGYEKKEVISLEVNGDDNLNSYGSVEFSDLEDGNYTLTITSTTNKYQEYKQDFVVEGLEYAIQLYAGEMEVDTQQNAHLGVLQYRMYGEQELKEILDEIEKRTDTLDYDLNSDNVVNLLDLQLFSAYYSTNPKENILSMDVEMNKIIVSIKINEILSEPKEKIKRELSMNLLFDLLFSKSSKLYNDWLNKGIINDSFSASFTQERDYAFIQIGCDCDDYETLKNHLLDLIKNFKELKIEEKDFERIKKKNIGLFINLFNSPESIANLFSRYYFEGTIALNLVDEVADIQLKDIYNTFKYFDIEYTSTCIVKKK